MGNIGNQTSSGPIRDLSHSGKIDPAWIGGAARENQAGSHRQRQPFHFVIVNQFIVMSNLVGGDIEPASRKADRRPVRKMPSAGKVEPHDPVAGFKQGKQGGDIGVGAGVGLNIGIGRTEQLAGAVDGELLDQIDCFATTIIAARRTTFRVFVGQDGPLGGAHITTDDVFGRDHLDMILLTLFLLKQGLLQLRIG